MSSYSCVCSLIFSELSPPDSGLARVKRENEGIWKFLSEDNSVVYKPTILLYNPLLQVSRSILCPSFSYFSVIHLIQS